MAFQNKKYEMGVGSIFLQRFRPILNVQQQHVSAVREAVFKYEENFTVLFFEKDS